MLILFIDLRWLILKAIENKPLPAITPAAAILLAFITYLLAFLVIKLLNLFAKKTEWVFDDFHNGLKGLKGERIAYLELAKILPSDYKIYPNLTIPGYKCDFDFIVVGSKGVFMIDVKNHEKQTIYKSDKAYFKGPFNNLIQSVKDSRNSLDYEANLLENYFQGCDLGKIKISKAILYLNSESVRIDDYKNIYRVYIIRGTQGLKEYFNNSFEKHEFNIEKCENICFALEQLNKHKPTILNLLTAYAK